MNSQVTVDEEKIASLITDLFTRPAADKSIFSSVVRNNTVTMVATSSHIRGGKQGKDIDAAGPVLRFSTCLDMVPFDEGLAEDIGFRNDVYYIIPSFLEKFVGDLDNNVRKCAAYGVRSIRVNFVDRRHEYRGTLSNINTVRMALAKISAPTEISHGPNALSISCRLLVAAGGHRSIVPRGGFQALVDLILHEAKVRTRGMTFYHGGDNFSRSDTAPQLDPALYHHGKKQCKHDSTREVLVVNRMWRMFPKMFDFDSVFQEIVERYDRPTKNT